MYYLLQASNRARYSFCLEDLVRTSEPPRLQIATAAETAVNDRVRPAASHVPRIWAGSYETQVDHTDQLLNSILSRSSSHRDP